MHTVGPLHPQFPEMENTVFPQIQRADSVYIFTLTIIFPGLYYNFWAKIVNTWFYTFLQVPLKLCNIRDTHIFVHM